MLILSVVLSACNLQSATPTQISPDQISTIAKATVDALTTQMAPPPATNTPMPTEAPTATATLAIPTLDLTALPTLGLATSTLIPLPTTSTSSTCNRAYFISETIPDNTVYLPGQKFEKSWTIKNDGTCSWTPAYSAVPVVNSPDSPVITGDNAKSPGSTIAPGGTWVITVSMTAPDTEGTYQQSWKMVDADGKYFGIGDGGNAWWVKIKVSKSGTTSMTITTNIAGLGVTDGSVGDTVEVDGAIQISGLASGGSQVVKYRVAMGGKTMGCGGTLTFTTNGSQSFNHSDCKVPDGLSAGTHQVLVYISEPGGSNVASGLNFTIN